MKRRPRALLERGCCKSKRAPLSVRDATPSQGVWIGPGPGCQLHVLSAWLPRASALRIEYTSGIVVSWDRRAPASRGGARHRPVQPHANVGHANKRGATVLQHGERGCPVALADIFSFRAGGHPALASANVTPQNQAFTSCLRRPNTQLLSRSTSPGRSTRYITESQTLLKEAMSSRPLADTASAIAGPDAPPGKTSRSPGRRAKVPEVQGNYRLVGAPPRSRFGRGAIPARDGCGNKRGGWEEVPPVGTGVVGGGI